MDWGLEGLKVIVTGGAAGIGRAVVEAFLAEGALCRSYGGSSTAAEVVHPSTCGEQTPQPSFCALPIGSSPPVRGTVHVERDWGVSTRFIPARAGNRLRRWVPFAGRTVHPRPCGEQAGQHPYLARKGGSSPPVRGTVHVERDWGVSTRFIPARAGNRLLRTPCQETIFTMSPDPPAFPTLFAAYSRGEKDTSFNPSKSTGMRRLRPSVRKSKP